jgi:hypothetical protein
MEANLPTVALIANAAAAWFLTGLIWIVQVVHYPLFASVGRDGFVSYEAAHARLITLVVGPVMLVELAAAAALAFLRPAAVPAWAAWTGLGLVAAIWLSTFLVQVPLHGTLAGGFDADAHARLVATNWFRTAAWTVRALLAAWLVYAALTGSSGRPGQPT